VAHVVEPDRRDAGSLDEPGEPVGYVVGVQGPAILGGEDVAGISACSLPGDTKENPPVALTESDLSDLLAALKAGEMTDTIRTSLEWILQQLIEAEATVVIGAGPHERTDSRTTQRNGQRPRLLSKAAGDVELKIPKLRTGSFFPSLLERRRRIDRAQFAVAINSSSASTPRHVACRSSCRTPRTTARGYVAPPTSATRSPSDSTRQPTERTTPRSTCSDGADSQASSLRMLTPTSTSTPRPTRPAV
jgi:hypothetical protein